MIDVVDYIAAGGLLAVLGIVLKQKGDTDKAVSRNFSRLDEVKKTTEEKFTSKEVCHILHTQITKDLHEIKVDLKSLLRKNGIKE